MDDCRSIEVGGISTFDLIQIDRAPGLI